MTPEIRARIEADMVRAAGMGFGELVGYLAHYSAGYDDEIRRGVLTRQQMWACADAALERARTSAESPR